MSLIKLLSVSKTFAGGTSQPGRYKMAEQGLLPKFAPVGRPVSLAPKLKTVQPAAKKEFAAARLDRSGSLAEKLPESAGPAPAAAMTPRAALASAVRVGSGGTNWFRLGKNPFVNRPAKGPNAVTPVQSELSLDAVKPLRNDLSDSDLEVVPAKAELKTKARLAPRQRLFKPELAGLAWSRWTARFFNSERVRV
jgi:hypothetical protein